MRFGITNCKSTDFVCADFTYNSFGVRVYKCWVFWNILSLKDTSVCIFGWRGGGLAFCSFNVYFQIKSNAVE